MYVLRINKDTFISSDSCISNYRFDFTKCLYKAKRFISLRSAFHWLSICSQFLSVSDTLYILVVLHDPAKGLVIKEVVDIGLYWV